MARLEDDQNHGLPPPPAATRRGANPWRLSETASKPEQRQDSIGPELLADLMKKAPADDAHTKVQESPQAAAARARPGLMPFVVVGVVFIIVMRIFFQTRGGGDWTRFIGPLFVIAFIVHALWRLRQRRESKKSGPG
ncbi:MAG: hypothetical protein EXR87_06625 [Gammaproteobacteria bacterium]|nr:hypothetical protein [Gammaproteobacteria bacterium]